MHNGQHRFGKLACGCFEAYNLGSPKTMEPQAPIHVCSKGGGIVVPNWKASALISAFSATLREWEGMKKAPKRWRSFQTGGGGGDAATMHNLSWGGKRRKSTSGNLLPPFTSLAVFEEVRSAEDFSDGKSAL